MANNDLEIRIGVILDDVKKGKVELSQAVQEMTRIVQQGNQRAGGSTRTFGEQFEQSVTKKMFGATTAAKGLFSILRQLGFGFGIFGIATALVAGFITKLKEAHAEAKKLLELSNQISAQRTLQGQVQIPQADIISESKRLAQGTPFEKQPDLIARLFSIPGLNLTQENIKAISGLAYATGRTPEEMAKTLQGAKPEELGKLSGLSVPPKDLGKDVQQRFISDAFDLLFKRGTLINRQNQLDKMKNEFEKSRSLISNPLSGGLYQMLGEPQFYQNESEAIFQQRTGLDRLARERNANLSNLYQTETGNLRERTIRGERFKEIQAENMSEYEKEMLRLQKQNNRNTESLRFGRTNGSRTTLSE